MQVSKIDMLGRRDIDKQYNWSHTYRSDEESNVAINFIRRMRENGLLSDFCIEKNINTTNFSERQKKEFDIILTHYQAGESVDPFYMIVQGTAGTGKSYLIGGISKYLKQAAMSNQSPLLLLASIGVATFNIGGSTIHSKLKIPVKDFMQLEETCLTNF